MPSLCPRSTERYIKANISFLTSGTSPVRPGALWYLDKQTPQADGHPRRLPLTPPSDPSSPRLWGQPPTTSVLRQETRRHMEAGVCIRSMEISARASIRSSGNSSSCGKKHTDVWTGSPRTGRPDPGSVRGRPDRMWLRGCDLLPVDALFVVSGEQDDSNGCTSNDNCCV